MVGGEVWGRGALDVKGRVVSHLAAADVRRAAAHWPGTANAAAERRKHARYPGARLTPIAYLGSIFLLR